MPSLVTEQLLDGIRWAESRGERHPTKAVGDTKNTHHAHGAYQMTKPAYQDVQRMFPKEFGSIPFDQLLQSDEAFQRRAARRYLEGGEQFYGITDFNKLISFYNRGPKARYGRVTNREYVNTVLKHLGRPLLDEHAAMGGAEEMMMAQRPVGQSALRQSEGDAVEQSMRRLNRLMVAAGFDGMSAKEILSVLERQQPPQPVNGAPVKAAPDLPLGGDAFPGAPPGVDPNMVQNPMGALQRRPMNPAGSPAFGTKLTNPMDRMAPQGPHGNAPVTL